MGIIYKLYYVNREDYATTIVIHITYQMMVEGEYFDLNKVMRENLMENLQKTKTSQRKILVWDITHLPSILIP